MATLDPRRVADSKDAWVTALYAKTVGQTADDGVLPLLIDASGYLLVNLTVGTISITNTSSTINNAVGNPVNVSLVSTAVTVSNTVVTIGGGSVSATVSSTSITASTTVTGTVTTNVVAGNINVSSATLGTVTITGTISSNSVNATVSSVSITASVTVINTLTVSSTSMTCSTTIVNTLTVSSVSMTVSSISITASVTVINTLTVSSVSMTVSSISITASTSPIVGQTGVAADVGATGATVQRFVEANNAGRTLTTASGTLSATNGALTFTPSNRAKIYAISLTTTAATELICVFNSGGVANGVELWRATLMAPAGASAGLNLAVTPPAFLFQSRSGTAVSLSLNTATLIHYSVSYFDEA